MLKELPHASKAAKENKLSKEICINQWWYNICIL